jgi:hypothetical protein
MPLLWTLDAILVFRTITCPAEGEAFIHWKLGMI